MMERLTEPIGNGEYNELEPVNIDYDEYSYINFEKLVNKLGEYEDLEEQGLLLRLPCKVGDTIYKVSVWGRSNFDNKLKYRIEEHTFHIWWLPDMGKISFTTREEAEAKLRELEGEE